MADGSKISVLRRKAGEGRPQQAAGRMTPARVLRAAFTQGAEDETGLIVTVSKVEEVRADLPALIKALPKNPLLALCEGPHEQLALVVFDPDSLAAMIEMQTTGRVVPRPALARNPTRTDALLVGGFVDRLLQLFEEGAAEAELDIAPVVNGYRYSLPLAETRIIEMTLPDIAYRLFSLQVDYADGAKQGSMLMLMPHTAHAPAAGGESAVWQEKLLGVVQCAEVEMEAVLARKEMLLRDVAALVPGALVTLPRQVVEQVQLIDLDGVAVSFGALGQSGGFRAVRVTQKCGEDAPSMGAGAPAEMAASLPPPVAPPSLPGAMAGGGADPLAGLGDLPDMGGDLPGLADIDTGLSGLPEIDTGLPDLPDIGNDLPDLPDIGNDLPDLGAL